MATLNFTGKWRDYQKRILDDLNFHLADNKIHVVAAPGAGKTTLGIEVIARINKPALILTPTITIRNQWKQRILDSFLDESEKDIVSTNIKEPKFVTVITYQALLAAFCGTKEEDESEEKQELEKEEDDDITTNKRFSMEKAEEIIAALKKSKIKLLCFDEAHHLRNEWWKALDYLENNLNPEQTVALTATPPYDAEGKEWERYETLCGPIDELISIPELVENGDLCPHQDFVHFSLMRKYEKEKFLEYNKKISEFMHDFMQSEKVPKIVLSQLARTTEETILEEPKTYISLLSYLKVVGKELPSETLALYSLKASEIPPFKIEYQKLLLSYLFGLRGKIESENFEKEISELYKKARESGVVQNKTVYLNDSPKLKRQIANSIGKLDSIERIVELESQALKQDLRMVILADYIKYENLDASELGVIPIWQTLKDKNGISLAVLTGSIILIPKKISETLEKYAQEKDLQDYISTTPFDRDNNYLKVVLKGSKKSFVVDLITQMFNEGHITVMVGTQALLGEGWDAPSINSLVLSSTVSSYMLSNQMRGRAIRVDKSNPNKISNIWHLASIKKLSDMEQMLQKISFKPTTADEKPEPLVDLSDYHQLCQRFKGYQAPSFKAPFYIESGIERILPEKFLSKLRAFSTGYPTLNEADFLELNKIMETNAFNRQNTKDLWKMGVRKTYDSPERTLKTGTLAEIKTKDFSYTNGYMTKLIGGLSIWTVVFIYLLEVLPPLISLGFSFVGFVITMLRPTIKYLRCSSPEKVMRQIGIVFLETLSAMGDIKTSLHHVSLNCEISKEDFSVFFSAKNLSPEENNLLVKSMLEFINPIENPRYLFIRKDKLAGMIDTTDYHSIPAIISTHRRNIEIFKKLWEKYIGPCNIVYTRNAEGRRILLKARKDSFSALIKPAKAKQLSRYE